MRIMSIALAVLCTLFILISSVAIGGNLPTERADPSPRQIAGGRTSGPPAIIQLGDTTWIQVHTDGSSCPGDPNGGHGGEATGGPDATETWCLEGDGGSGDSCGTLPPWDVRCLLHKDMHLQPSDLGINYWHIDTYRADQQAYCGDYALWCGSDTLWEGDPVECGSWDNPPGYGNSWNCIAELTLPQLFSYAGGIILEFDTRYDTECNFDFLHAEYFNGETWENLASFTATSNNPGYYCTVPYEVTADYFSNEDIHLNCNWQYRTVPGSPAFSDTISAEDLSSAAGFSWVGLERGTRLFRHDAAYDSDRGRIVIYGGASELGMNPTYRSDTYEWDDTTWVDMSPASNPGARAGHQMVYFPDSSHTVLFGGEYESSLSGDTWVWDGSDWQELSPAHSPSARYGHGMAYDSVRGVIVLFGGEDSTGYVDDTWEWNGVDWVERFPVDSPAARYFLGANGLAYDPTRGVTVLFGGKATGDPYQNTWEWDGVNWTRMTPPHRPNARYTHGLAYHPDLGGVVLYGGSADDKMLQPESYSSDTRLWDGTEWTRLRPGVSAGSRGSFAMIYDHSIGKLILHGGTFDGIDANRGTWKLDFGDPLRLRWRFVSDILTSDADQLDTDGGAWIDNIMVHNTYEVFVEDFESGTADAEYWSFPDNEGLIDGWHMVHDPDPLYEGGDGGSFWDCRMDSSIVYRARPEGGFPAGAPWRDGWRYSLVTPGIPIQNTGCVVQYDMFWCSPEYTCDYITTRVRFYEAAKGTWCPWINPRGCALVGNCYYWHTDMTEDLTVFYGTTEDSLQFAWEFIDVSRPWEFCRGKHADTDLQIDNVSVGFFDSHVTQFSTRSIDLLHDTFHTGICGYNSFFEVYNPDTVTHYSGGTALPRGKQLNVDVIERDGVATVELAGSINEGGGWVTKTMTLNTVYDPDHPTWGGTYYGTFCPADFALAEWDTGTGVWYYVKVTDDLDGVEYFPATADPGHTGHTGLVGNYLDYSILPTYPPEYTDPKILLVDGFRDHTYDVSTCGGSGTVRTLLADLYSQILDDAGYPHDRYDILNAGGNVRLQPTDFSDYDAVIWFTGIGDNWYYCPFDGEAQTALRDYLAAAGKAIICGDRIARYLADGSEGGRNCDSLGGEFLAGLLGTDYLEEMALPLDKPLVECAPEAAVDVFGVPTPIDLDTLTIDRGCPEYREMCWVKTHPTPPAPYTAQPLLTVVNPDVAVAQMGTYVEYDGVGQCVFFDFDLSGTGYCNGGPLLKTGGFNSAWQDGRVELLRVVLEDLFGLPPNTSGVPNRPDLPDDKDFRWALHQNSPNPWGASTEIRYDVAAATPVRIKIYSPTGRLIRTLVDRSVQPGCHTAAWDGTNSSGKQVGDGIYFYKMEAGEFTATRKLLLMR